MAWAHDARLRARLMADLPPPVRLSKRAARLAYLSKNTEAGKDKPVLC